MMEDAQERIGVFFHMRYTFLNGDPAITAEMVWIDALTMMQSLNCPRVSSPLSVIRVEGFICPGSRLTPQFNPLGP
jgi:hypothetical protein